jgi:hypothetical protein
MSQLVFNLCKPLGLTKDAIIYLINQESYKECIKHESYIFQRITLEDIDKLDYLSKDDKQEIKNLILLKSI